MKSPADLSYYGIRPNIIEINSEFSTVQADQLNKEVGLIVINSAQLSYSLFSIVGS